jgi:hypothetical protein
MDAKAATNVRFQNPDNNHRWKKKKQSARTLERNDRTGDSFCIFWVPFWSLKKTKIETA